MTYHIMQGFSWPILFGVTVSGVAVSLFTIKAAALRSAVRQSDESEARVIVDANPDGLTRFDHDLVCTFASPMAADLFGRPLETMLGRSLKDLAGEDAATIVGAIDVARAESRVADAVFRLCRAADDCRWIEIRCAPLAGDSGLVASFRDITLRHAADLALRAANSELNKLAGSDALTELANRRRFDQMLETECRRASRNAAPLSLLLLDINDFRAFDDLHGHAAADACLKQVATVLRGEARRSGDVAARFGGEEFALLLPQADEAVAARHATALRAAVAALAIPHGRNADPSGIVTVDIGCATATPTPDTLQGAAAMLLADANRALHEVRRLARADSGLPARGTQAEPAVDGQPSRPAPDRMVPTRVAPGMHQIARIAAVLLGLPFGFVVLRQEADLVIVGHYGFGGDGIAWDWCTRGLSEDGLVMVPDAGRDPGYRRAWDEAGFGFLAAAPLRKGRGGPPIGVLWVADRVARAPWGEAEPRLLCQLAGLAADGLEPQPRMSGRSLKVA